MCLVSFNNSFGTNLISYSKWNLGFILSKFFISFSLESRFEISHIISSFVNLFSLQMQQWPNSKLNFFMKLLNCFKQDGLLCNLDLWWKKYDWYILQLFEWIFCLLTLIVFHSFLLLFLNCFSSTFTFGHSFYLFLKNCFPFFILKILFELSLWIINWNCTYNETQNWSNYCIGFMMFNIWYLICGCKNLNFHNIIIQFMILW
jgi:hypothetical protein